MTLINLEKARVGTLSTNLSRTEGHVRTVSVAAFHGRASIDNPHRYSPPPLSQMSRLMSHAVRRHLMAAGPHVTGVVFETKDGKTTLTEYNVIAYYLSELATDRSRTLQLVGATSEQRLAVMEWLFWNQARFEPTVRKLDSLVNDGQTWGPEQKAAAKELVDMVDHLERSLRDSNWQGRSSILETDEDTGPSLADIAIASTLGAAFAVGFDEDTREDYGNCLRLYERVSETPGLTTLFAEEEEEDDEDEAVANSLPH